MAHRFTEHRCRLCEASVTSSLARLPCGRSLDGRHRWESSCQFCQRRRSACSVLCRESLYGPGVFLTAVASVKKALTRSQSGQGCSSGKPSEASPSPCVPPFRRSQRRSSIPPVLRDIPEEGSFHPQSKPHTVKEILLAVDIILGKSNSYSDMTDTQREKEGGGAARCGGVSNLVRSASFRSALRRCRRGNHHHHAHSSSKAAVDVSSTGHSDESPRLPIMGHSGEGSDSEYSTEMGDEVGNESPSISPISSPISFAVGTTP
mmetsp:Transcript_39606/g.99190  ORF Transcript_39606/g.99190 Transcript_39606/m.99190 type:complete len:262 (+) Transcript_39606:191-976(+)